LLGWIAIGLLAWRPLDLWNVGFQLSLGLTATLFWLAPRFHARLWGERIKGLVKRDVGLGEKVLEKLKEAVSTGVLCWLASLPLVMLRFGLVSPLAIVTSIVVTPLVVVILWVGYIALLVGVFVPSAADAAGYVLNLLTISALSIVKVFDSVGWSAVRVPVVSALWAMGATAVVVHWARHGHRRDWRAWAASAVIVAWFGWQSLASGGLPRGVALRIDTFCVGNGTCHLLRSGRETMLWDCGPMKGAGAMPPLVSAVRELGAWRTPVVVITHPDIDHFGGLLEVVEPLGVETVLVGERFAAQAQDEPAGAAAALVRGLKMRGVVVRTVAAGDVLELGAARAVFVSPPLGAEWKLDNDQSLVAVLGLDGNEGAVLMTGDVQDEAIGFLTGMRLRSRVLELPHHGSARPAAIRFAATLDPEIVLQSTGDLRAGDPRWDSVREGRLWFTTCTNGASWVELMEDGRVRCGSMR
jgi:competence protein ComEC